MCVGKSVEPGVEFWDLVVISAMDENQAEAYRIQLSDKIDNNELPLAKYRVIADKPGVKMGIAGSTFNIIQVIE